MQRTLGAYLNNIRLPGDITQKSEVTRLAKEVGDQEPSGIHLLVNNVRAAFDAGASFFT